MNVNVADKAEAESLVDTAVAKYGRIDVLCNNAGVMDQNQGVGEVSDDIWRRVLSINLDGPMYLTRRAVPIMIKQGGGSIVNTASVAGVEGGAAGVAYTASKHALVGLTRNTAWRYVLDGIRCNAIAAGAVATNIMASVDATKMDPQGSARYGVYTKIIPGYLNRSTSPTWRFSLRRMNRAMSTAPSFRPMPHGRRRKHYLALTFTYSDH